VPLSSEVVQKNLTIFSVPVVLNLFFGQRISEIA
jgi:hypothetical protein